MAGFLTRANKKIVVTTNLLRWIFSRYYFYSYVCMTSRCRHSMNALHANQKNINKRQCYQKCLYVRQKRWAKKKQTNIIISLTIYEIKKIVNKFNEFYIWVFIRNVWIFVHFLNGNVMPLQVWKIMYICMRMNERTTNDRRQEMWVLSLALLRLLHPFSSLSPFKTIASKTTTAHTHTRQKNK